jgi:AbrB family looped-hinge helix DNA binding protein
VANVEKDAEIVLGRMKVHGRGRIQLPREARELLGIQDNDFVYIVVNREKEIVVRKSPQVIRIRYE